MSLAGAVHGGLVFPRRIRVLAGHLAELLPASGRVLDIGCGDGSLALRVAQARPGLQLRGVDVLVRENTRIEVERFDGHLLPYPDLAFDAAMIVDVLHHTDDPEGLLAEAARVAPVLVIKDHLADAPLAGMRLRLMDFVGNARHGVRLPYNYWTRRRWEEAFEQLGLRVEQWRGELGLYPPPASWIFDASLHFAACLSRHRA
ncbi:MAG TPA: class I SAM-dependent methyltransferase [Thermoanaerobaculia bacterium]